MNVLRRFWRARQFSLLYLPVHAIPALQRPSLSQARPQPRPRPWPGAAVAVAVARVVLLDDRGNRLWSDRAVAARAAHGGGGDLVAAAVAPCDVQSSAVVAVPGVVHHKCICLDLRRAANVAGQHYMDLFSAVQRGFSILLEKQRGAHSAPSTRATFVVDSTRSGWHCTLPAQGRGARLRVALGSFTLNTSCRVSSRPAMAFEPHRQQRIVSSVSPGKKMVSQPWQTRAIRLPESR